MAKLSMALVLCDVAAHGLKAGQLLEASSDVVASLAKAGEVDPHKDAVAHARSNGATVVRSSIELAAEQRATAADALRVRIAELEALQAKDGTDEATKAALSTELADKRGALTALTA